MTVQLEDSLLARSPATNRLTLAELMKKHEQKNRHVFSTEDYVLIRLDGKAFRTYTRNLDEPYDLKFMEAMDQTLIALCREIQGVRFAYVESDEISLLITGWRNAPITEANPKGLIPGELWMGGVASKITSLSAALATAHFNRIREEQLAEDPTLERENFHRSLAYFDSRVWSFPGTENGDLLLEKYFLWRQRASIKNSASMAARLHFSAQELHSMHSDTKQELLRKIGEPWENLPDRFRYGCYTYGVKHVETVLVFDSKLQVEVPTQVTRNHWTLRPMVDIMEALDEADIPAPIR